jgi:putative FmdB family regulatory protein
MPLYEYKCTNCGERVEVIQRSSDSPQGPCPKCGGEMKKLFSAPAIQFKGSGFYKTDYAAKPAAASESKSESKTETKSESKSESKSETKSESSTTTSTKSE